MAKKVKNMCLGDSCNQSEWQMSNHTGTHIDCPSHFDNKGKTLSDYPPEFWSVKKTQLFNVNIGKSLMINLSDSLAEIDNDTEFLIIKTGFCYKRNHKEYWESGPGITAESGTILRKLRPNLKFIGFDFISLTSFQNREEGRRAHKAFLGHFLDKKPILPIEDMDLTKLNTSPSKVILSPTLVEKADGAPITVIADI